MLASLINPLALAREEERLRHMARRARRCQDLAPSGWTHEHYAERLERQARDMRLRLGTSSH